MRKLVARIETGDKMSEKAKYEGIFCDVKAWYLEQYKHYEMALQNDMVSKLGKEVQDQIDRWAELGMVGYTDNFSAKANLFNMADVMCKLMLSVYTYGPDSSISVEFKRVSMRKSWLECKLNANYINELLQMQLQIHKEGERINLAALTEDRAVRNDLTHHGEVSVCTSAIRCYNILREMIIFMEPESSSKLPRFSYPHEAACDMQKIMGRLQDFHFGDENTLLVVGSLHDIPAEAKALVANLPWTVVLDFDGYSSFGGLRSSVIHENISDQKLKKDTATGFKIRKGYTAWFTCGDFCNYSFCQTNPDSPENEIFFKTMESFSERFYHISSDLEDCLNSILKELSDQLRPLNILYLYYHDMTDPAHILINLCERHYHRANLSYTFTAAYYELPAEWNEISQRLSRSYKTGLGGVSPLETVFCDLNSLMDGLLEYKNFFQVRISETEPHKLPSEEGCTRISNNLAMNLAEVFDVLYDDVGEVPPDTADSELSDFYHGGTASWSVFSYGQSCLLMRKNEYEKNLDEIRDTLKHIPEAHIVSQKIFNLIHAPGIGGSTLLRQIGWDLHKEYPVLLIRRYDSRIKNLVRQLYDDRKKGILLLADESVSDIARLKDDICTLDRACALIVSGRKDYLSIGKKERKILFQAITDSGEKSLRNRFKEYSSLATEELNKKDQNYDSFIETNRSEMRCPFMIGLYYQDVNFNGIEAYIKQLMDAVRDEREVKIMAMLALCDSYGQIGLPKILVDQYLNIPISGNYLGFYPYAKSAFLFSRGFDGNVDIYRSKHYLISNELLEQCSKRLFNSTSKSSLTDLSQLLIDTVFSMYKAHPSEVYQEILERVFIDKSGNQDKFSRLILDIATPIFRKDVLEYLTTQFNSLVESSDPDEANELYRMTAHFYGHLGRLCANRDYGLDNPQAAKLYCEKAVSLMEESSQEHPDPLIYHMLGEARKSLLQKQWNNLAGNRPSENEYSLYERELDVIRSIFDQAAQYGSADYAIVSEIGMYTQYLRKVYLWKDITKPEHITRLTTQQAAYREEIEELLEQSSTMELDERSWRYLQELDNEYRAHIMLSHYGSAIQYYENLLAQLSGYAGKDLEIQDARRGLITARLANYYDKVKKKQGNYVAMEAKELISILTLLEEVLGQSIDPSNYRQRNQRISSYDRWFHLAKMKGSGRTLVKALRYAERWMELDNQCHSNDPRPYYYYYVCSKLCALAGNKIDNNKMEASRITCYKLAQGRYQTETIRDVLVRGTELEQLIDMRFAGRDISEYLQSAAAIPLVLEGVFDRVSANKGYIKLRSPIQWVGTEVKFTLGTKGRMNSVGENQLTHSLGTFAGFSFEQICAINQYVKDYTGKEEIPQLRLKEGRSKTSSTLKPRTAIVCSKNLIGTHGTFIARKVTKKGGLSGILKIKGQECPATLQKQYVTKEMRNLLEKKQIVKTDVMVSAVDTQYNRCVLKLFE